MDSREQDHMSFYHKLAQHSLSQHFILVNAKAVQKDSAMGGLAKYARDTKLSQEKQECGHRAYLNLNVISWEAVLERFGSSKHYRTADDCAKEMFEQIIKDYANDVQDKIKKAGASNSGETGNAISEAEQQLAFIRKLCEEYQLWDRDYDENDPGDIFIYKMLEYLCERSTSREQLTRDKIDLTKSELRKIINYFSKNADITFEEKVDYVCAEIQSLTNANKVACSENARIATVPATIPGNMMISAAVSVLKVNLSTSIGSSEGSLGEKLTQALDRISKLSENSQARKSRTERVLNSAPGNRRSIRDQNIERDGLTLENWLQRYNDATTVDEKDDIFIGAINLDNNDCLFQKAPAEIKNNQDRVFDAALINVHTLKFASYKILSNRTFMLNLIKQEPAAFAYASERLKRDPEVKKAAMSPLMSTLFAYQHFFGAALIGLITAAIAMTLTLTLSSLIIPAVIAISVSSAVITSTASFFALRPAETRSTFAPITDEHYSSNSL